MSEGLIEGVVVKRLDQIPDERGKVMHFMRCDDPDFVGFGEVYFSMVFPGVVKGWHLHKVMTLNYTVPVGIIKLVLYDAREDSPTRGQLMELFIGEGNYSRVTVPPGVWNGFKDLGTNPSIVCNCASHPYDPSEIVRMSPTDGMIPYSWDIVMM